MRYSKTCLKGHSENDQKLVFNLNQLSLNEGQKYCRMLQGEHLQYFRPSLRYNLSLRSLFCLFLISCLRQVLLYAKYREAMANSVKVFSDCSLRTAPRGCFSCFNRFCMFSFDWPVQNEFLLTFFWCNNHCPWIWSIQELHVVFLCLVFLQVVMHFIYSRYWNPL